MAESVFRVLQLGVESTFGTSVAATTVYPCDPGSGEFTLNRASNVPDEDYGQIGRNQPNRGSTGVRIATASLASEARFEDLGHLLKMALGTPVSSGTPATLTFTGDNTSDTVKSYTVETHDDTQDFIAKGVVCTKLDLGFDAIAPGQNVPWKISADLQAVDHATGTATGSISAPSTLETIEGHLTKFYEGPAGTAFGSLTELSAALVSYKISIQDEKPLRPYGSATDTTSAKGRLKRQCTIDILVKETGTAVADSFTIYNVSGSLPTNRRWRVKATGSGSKALTIDTQVQIVQVNVDTGSRSGERLIHAQALGVVDSSLSSDIQVTLTSVGALA